MTAGDPRQAGPPWQSLVDGSPDGILAFDLQFRYTVWNRAMEDICGIPAERVLGRVAWEVFPFLTEQGEDAHFRAALVGEVTQTANRPFHVPESGRAGYFRAEYGPVRDAAGAIVGGMAVVRETTASVRAGEALQTQALVLERMSEGVSVVDENGFIVYTNPAEDRMFGYQPGELVGSHVTVQNDYPPEENQRIMAEVMERLKRDGEWVGEWRNVRRDGTPFFTRARITALELAGRVHWVCVQQDITDERRVERERTRLSQHLEFLAAASSELASSLDFGRTLSTVAHLAVPSVADWCFVEVLQPDGCIELVAVGHQDPSMEELARETLRRYPVDPAAPHGTGRVIRTGEPELLSEIGPELLDAVAQDEQHREILRGIGFRSYLTVPLAVHGRVIGALSLAQSDSGRRFCGDDLPLVQELALRAAVAIDNARLFRAARESGALVDTLFQTAPVSLGFVDRGLRYRRVNDALARMSGSTPEQMEGRPLREVIPELAPTVEPLYRRVIEGEEIRGMEVSGPRPGAPSEAGHWLVNYTPVRASDGELLGVGMAGLDITERKRIEEAQRFLADASAVLAGSLDVQETLVQVARMVVERLADACAIDLATSEGTLERVTVLSRDPAKVAIVEELEGRYPTPLDSPAGHTTAYRTGEPQLYTDFSDALLRSASRDEEHFRLWKSLGMREVINAPLIARGHALGVISLVLDTPGRSFRQADLEVAVELARRAAMAIDNARLFTESQEANRSKADFLAAMSHELRTPLNPILGYTDLLEVGVPEPVPSGSLRHVERIKLASRHLRSLIEEILMFARLEAGKEHLDLHSFDARGLVEEVQAIVEPLAGAAKLTLSVQLPPEPLRMHSDPRKLRQVLINLLHNAVKFTDQGGVELRAWAEGADVCFRVHDTGRGIAPEHLRKIFEPFWQVDQSSTRTAGGTGLGLAVSRRLAHALGGDIQLESELGSGSTFTLRLPLRAPAE